MIAWLLQTPPRLKAIVYKVVNQFKPFNMLGRYRAQIVSQSDVGYIGYTMHIKLILDKTRYAIWRLIPNLEEKFNNYM